MRFACCTLGFVVASIRIYAIAQARENKRIVHLPVTELVGAISNADIVWGYTWHYRTPQEVRGASRLVALHCDVSAAPALMAALDDPQRFIAAHCLLTVLFPLSMEAGPAMYGGLRFDDNEMPIRTEAQRLKLKCLWKVRLFILSFVAPPRLPSEPPRTAR